MCSALLGRVPLRARSAPHSGIAAVEKVLILSAIVGMVTFSTLVFGKFSDYSTSLKAALSAESLPNLASGNPNLSASNPPMADVRLSYSQSGSIANSQLTKVWLAVGIGLSFVMVATAVFLTRDKRKKRKVPSTPATEISEVKKKLEPKVAPGNVFTKRQQIMALLLNRLGGEAFEEMRIGHLVSPKVTTVLPSTTLEEIKTMFLSHHFRHLFVCDVEGNLHGIISARDLQRSQTGFAQDIMSTDIVTTGPEQLISPTITLMMERRISCLPVVDNDRLLGIVTTTDLLIALQCTLKILQTLGTLKTEKRKPAGGLRSGPGNVV